MNRKTVAVFVTVFLAVGLFALASPAAAQAEGEVSLSLQPSDAEVGPGGEQQFDIVVVGPDGGISSFAAIQVQSGDTAVAEIVDYEMGYNVTASNASSNSAIQDDNGTLVLEGDTGDELSGNVSAAVLATMTVGANGTDGSSTDLVLNNSAGPSVSDSNETTYNVLTGLTQNATLSVAEPSPADYQLSALNPGDTSALVGDGTVPVSADVGNEGDLSGNQTVTLTVENETESVVYSEQVSNFEVDAGTTSTVGFQGLPVDSLGQGNYTYTVASENDTITANLSVETIADIDLTLLDAGTPLGEGDEIPAGTNLGLQVDATDTAGNTMDVTDEFNANDPSAGDLVVTSSDPAVISIGSFLGTTVITAQSTGTTTMSADYQTPNGNVSDAVNLTVTPAIIDSFDITIRNELAVGDVQNATIDAVYTDGSRVNVTEEFTLTSNDSAVASVSMAGGQFWVEGESTGTVTLTANETGSANQTTQVVEVVDPEVAFNVSDGEGGAGLIGTVNLTTESLVSEPVNVADYTVAIDYNASALELNEVSAGEVTVVEPGHAILTGAPGTAPPHELAEIEFLVEGNVSQGEVYDIGILPAASEYINTTGGFFSDPVYGLPDWKNGSITIADVPTGFLSGSVTDDTTGNPIQGATVTAEQFQTTTDANGEYTLEVPTGNYTPVITAEGYITQTVTASLPADGVTETINAALSPVDYSFSATNLGGESPVPEGGYIALNETNRSAALDGGLAFPAGNISIDGEVGENDVWYAGPEDVSFPNLTVTNELVGDVNVTVEATQGLTGTLNESNGTLTAEGPLLVTVPLLGESLTIDLQTTSGQSGSLEGSLGLEPLGGSAKLVNNDLTVPSSGSGLIDGQLGLPITNGSLTWVELPLAIESTDIGEPAFEYNATNQGGVDPVPDGGYIALNETNRPGAIANGLNFSAGGIQIEGTVGETGAWYAGPEDVTFPAVEPVTGITAQPTAPEGLKGTFDAANDTLTAEGVLEVAVPALGESLSIDLDLQTGTSGNLTGSANLSADGGTATLVNNELTVPSSGNALVDGAIGLPLEEPGLGWVEIPLSIDTTVEAQPEPSLSFADQGIDNGSVTVEGVDSLGNASAVLVTYEDGNDTVVAGLANGSFTGESVTVDVADTGGFPGTHTAHLVGDQSLAGSLAPGDVVTNATLDAVLVQDDAYVSVEIGGNVATDTTGDGLLNDVDGDDDFTIFDVQVLFENLDDPTVQANANLFDFAGQDDGVVDVFDIQAQFNDLDEQPA